MLAGKSPTVGLMLRHCHGPPLGKYFYITKDMFDVMYANTVQGQN